MIKKPITKKERKLASGKHTNGKTAKVKPIIYDENAKNVSVIAIDTNLFITLTRVNENNRAEKGEEGYNQVARDIKRLAMSGHLKLVLLPTVVEELLYKMTEQEKQFMEKYCFVVDSASIEGFEELIRDFALDLASYELVNNKGNKKTLLNDPKVAAESMYFGLTFVTGNKVDFIFYGKYEKNINRDARAGAIAKYGKYYLQKHNITPKKHLTPIMPAQFLETFKTISYTTDIKLYKATMQNLIDYVGPEHVMFDTPDEWDKRDFNV